MKSVFHIRLKRSFLPTVFLLLCSAFCGCERDSDLDLPLAVNSNGLLLETKGGATHIMIYSDGDWNVRFNHPIQWGALNVLGGTGNRDVVFSYAENLEAARRVRLLISNSHATDTVVLVQKGFTTQLALQENEIDVPRSQAGITIPLTTNLKEQFYANDYQNGVRIVVTDPDAVITGDDNEDEDEDEEKPGDEFPWILKPFSGSPEHIGFGVAPNDTGEDRQAKITVFFLDGQNKLTSTSVLVTQTAEAPTLDFESEELVIGRPATTASVKLKTNLTYSTSQCKAEVNYTGSPGGEEWVSDFRFEGNDVSFDAAENNTGANRSAVITVVYTDPVSREQLHASMNLIQYTIEKIDLRLLIAGAAGTATVEDNIALEGFVISDTGNPNMETNPNKNLTSVDFSENDRTAYLEMTDGSYGYRLKFDNAEENLLKRYSKITIAAKGLTVLKEDNPTRYTLTGVTAAHVTGMEEGQSAALPVKERTIASLTDDDLHTFVTLTNVQIGISDGAYTNVNDGYQTPYTVDGVKLNPNGTTSPRYDCVPLTFFDKAGDDILMLVNGKTPWRRTGSGVPAGSGSLKGIVVHSELLRYGTDGNIGRYAIRPLDEDDIALDASKGFAQTLVEWNWNDSNLNRNDNGSLAPNAGEGALYSTIADKETTPYQLTASFNNKVNDTSAKGLLSNTAANFCCAGSNSWWNFAANRGEAIVSEFSTEGIAADRMVLVFDILGGNGSNTSNKFPTRWHLEYSTDGANYTAIDDSGICVRPLVWWSNTGIYCTPGLSGYAVKLPADRLCGQAKVWLALRASDKSYCAGTNNNAEGAENGTLSESVTQTGHVRISTYSIKYY